MIIDILIRIIKYVSFKSIIYDINWNIMIFFKKKIIFIE